MHYSEEQWKQLHKVLLEILEYVDIICKQNNLQYLLIGGTALGARRHGGFIPWDDDVDIGVPRGDYERLLMILKTKKDGYKIQDETTEKKYFCPFAKLRKNGTVFKEKISIGLYEDNGIYIDIFPIDTLSEVSSLNTKIKLYKIKILNHALRFRYCRELYCSSEKASTFKHWILYIPFIFFSRDYLMKKLVNNMTSQNNREKHYAANLAGTNKLEKEIMEYDVFFPTKELEFEGKKYPCPNQIDQYLKKLYGNFIELPPMEKRRTHEPIELKF